MEATLTFISLTNYQEGTSAKGPWKKQEAVFETREQYPKKIAIIRFNAMADSLAACTPNQPYDVKFDIESREWNGKWYTDIRAFGISAHPVAQPQQQTYTAPPPPRRPRQGDAARSRKSHREHQQDTGTVQQRSVRVIWKGSSG